MLATVKHALRQGERDRHAERIAEEEEEEGRRARPGGRKWMVHQFEEYQIVCLAGGQERFDALCDGRARSVAQDFDLEVAKFGISENVGESCGVFCRSAESSKAGILILVGRSDQGEALTDQACH